MAALKAIGNLLDGGGWGSALVQAGVATPGTADSFCRVTHVTRSRRAHQITAGSLFVLFERLILSIVSVRATTRIRCH